MRQHAHNSIPTDKFEGWPADWQNDEYWTEAQTARYVKFHRTHIYRMEVKGEFPARINISVRRVVWKSSAVKAWMLAAADQQARTALSKGRR